MDSLLLSDLTLDFHRFHPHPHRSTAFVCASTLANGLLSLFPPLSTLLGIPFSLCLSPPDH